MATELQYRLVNEVWSLANDESMSRAAFTEGGLVRFGYLRDAIMAGDPLIDVTAAYRVVAQEDTMRSESSFARFVRPFEIVGDLSVRPSYKVPWNRSIFCCDFAEISECALWVVEKVNEAPGFMVSSLSMCIRKGRLDANDTKEAGWHEFTATRVGLALAAARNANWDEPRADRATRRRYPAVAGIRFRHIEIDMGKPKSMHKASERYKEAETPWHHRRGHWAYYGPDKPLFGRKGADGWYWRPYTEVGDKQYGEIVQDYSIRAPEGTS
jgi:hypothetical protein